MKPRLFISHQIDEVFVTTFMPTPIAPGNPLIAWITPKTSRIRLADHISESNSIPSLIPTGCIALLPPFLPYPTIRVAHIDSSRLEDAVVVPLTLPEHLAVSALHGLEKLDGGVPVLQHTKDRRVGTPTRLPRSPRCLVDAKSKLEVAVGGAADIHKIAVARPDDVYIPPHLALAEGVRGVAAEELPHHLPQQAHHHHQGQPNAPLRHNKPTHLPAGSLHL
jgi:hypothetical protein